MKSVLKPAGIPLSTDSIERLLSRYYSQLVEWSRILARGDDTVAEEIVQDLCLHLTVARPDFSRVQNVDNYLFMCLRNMYASNLARVSRERLRVIHVEDFDAVGIIAANGELKTQDTQNELIRICDYVVSRKYASKSASQFILHFFLGYRRSDVALLARLPISAVYNGLKDVRSELRERLSAGDRIRLVQRGAAPESILLRAAIPTDLLLKRLRSTILDGDPAVCRAEDELVDSYTQADTTPVGCRELAHLAGCERCMGILERVLRLDDRDGPFDGIDTDLERTPKPEKTKSFDAAMRLVRRRRDQLLERRPGLLAIAVNGRVVAFHAVESAHNSLSSRVESDSTVNFIEVFDEYGDRLAHLPVDREYHWTSNERLSQQVLLSDQRRLRLDVSLDGLGIHAEVDYVDPALAPRAEPEKTTEPRKIQYSRWQQFWRPERFRWAPWGGVVFASLALAAVLAIAGYWYSHPGWQDVLAHAQAVVQVPSPDETLHQILRVEQIIGPQNGSILGSVDVWRSEKRTVRRLYNAHQQLLATSVDFADGTASVHLENSAPLVPGDRTLVESGIWRSDVSAAAFVAHRGTEMEASRTLSGFELTQRGNGSNGILVRTLVLDRSYRVQAERVRYRSAGGVLEIRLVQTFFRKVSNSGVPAFTFPQSRDTTAPGIRDERRFSPEWSDNAHRDATSANLEVSVLFQLFQQNADIGQPVEVAPIAGGRIRIAGTVADVRLLAAIRDKLAGLPNASRIDFQVYSAADAALRARRGKTQRREILSTDSEAPAAGLVRNALLARGLKEIDMQKAEQEFTAAALTHAQAALQHAYALERLGTILQDNGAASLNPDAQVKWAQMVERHSAAALTELQVLSRQLASVSPGIAGTPSIDANGITDTAAFARTSSELLVKTQLVNEEVVRLLAGSAADVTPAQARDSMDRLQEEIPVAEVTLMRSFASRLAGRNASQQNEIGEIRRR